MTIIGVGFKVDCQCFWEEFPTFHGDDGSGSSGPGSASGKGGASGGGSDGGGGGP